MQYARGMRLRHRQWRDHQAEVLAETEGGGRFYIRAVATIRGDGFNHPRRWFYSSPAEAVSLFSAEVLDDEYVVL
jgi:hypothetical protein